MKNTGRRAVNLTGWTLTSRRTHATYRFRLRLGGHQQVRVHTGRGHNTMDAYQNHRTCVWDNRRDTAVLRPVSFLRARQHDLLYVPSAP
ncbi:lamin tail domain-containing protein [Streptomyces chrestomyceticus]|uniref:Lamin tail domain-containing protein n=1 Tax=Streptomyces chrestomyceticus TaxID=68185 RepID=A0ABU7X2U9_9ACTN